MKKIFSIIILIVLSYAIQNCQNKNSVVNEIKNVNLGDKLSSVIEKLNIKTENLQSIQEPTLILHGFSFSDNNDIGYLIIEQTPIKPENIGLNSKIFNQVKDKKIIGIAWKKGNSKNYIGLHPPRWN